MNILNEYKEESRNRNIVKTSLNESHIEYGTPSVTLSDRIVSVKRIEEQIVIATTKNEIHLTEEQFFKLENKGEIYYINEGGTRSFVKNLK